MSNKIKTLWLVFASIAYTGYICLCAILMQTFQKINRSWVDSTLQKWVEGLLKRVDATCIVKNPFHVEPSPNRATMIMCNHTSLYDIPLSFKVFPKHSIRMLAKKELYKIPIMGKGMVAAEFPFVDRKNRDRAMKDLHAVKNLMNSGIIVWVAPEGTRSQDGQLKSFKKGAFITAIETKAMIIPIGIRGAFNILPPKTWKINTKQKVEIHVGKPIDASDYTITHKNELINTVHQAISELLT